MMRIELKCRCGAEAVFDDPRSSYVQPGGDPDAEGRKFQIEKTAAEWQKCHNTCAVLVKDER